MLQAIRSKATSFVVKILFALLIITFGVWGIGDIFRTGSTDTTVATVGDRAVTQEEFGASLQSELEQLQSQFGRSISTAQAKELGVVDSVLQRLIDRQLADLAVTDLHLRIGDDALRQALIANPNFRDAAGVFDRNTFLAVLQANHMTEPQFESAFRDDMLRSDLAGAVADGFTAPQVLVTTLYRARFERRVADTVTLPPASAGTIAAPSAEQIAEFYKAHQDRFQTPELRSFTAALLTLDQIAAGITVPADKLQQEYQARQNEFNVPEQRQFEQMLLPDEAKAKDAEAQLVAGKDFAAVAKAEINADPQSLDLGWVKRTDLPDALAAAAYALKVGEVTQPIHTEFGWHILRLVATKPPTTQSFAEVKDKLTKEVALDMAGDQVANTANQIDDAIAGGAALGNVAQKFSLKTIKVADVDAKGVTADGKKITDLPQDSSAILSTAFATEAGHTSDLLQLGNQGYYLVQVDKVTPAAARPLVEVHDEAAKLWQDDARNQALAKAAAAIASEVNAGKSLKDVAAAHKLTVATTKPFLHTGGDDSLSPDLISKLFTTKPDQATTAAAGETYVVAQVTSIIPADPSQDQARAKDFEQQLGRSMQNDLLSEFDQALRRKFPVAINQANVDRAL